MAVVSKTGGTNGGQYASKFTGRLTVTEGDYVIVSNSSPCYYKLELISGSSGRFSGYGASYSVSIDGIVRNSGSGTYSSQSYNTAQTICEGTVWIEHNADGTKKNMAISAVLDFASGTYSPGDFNLSGTMDLTTIPRASSISATDANIGSSSSIGINSAADSFKHTVTYSFGSKSGTIKTKTTEKNFLWDIPTSFFEEIPNDSIGTVTLTCYTYNGDSHIGTTTKTMTVNVPYSGTYNSTPVITSATAIDTNTTTKNLTGNNKRLVLYKSTVQLSATGQCKNYAGFKSFKENNIYDLTSTTSVSGGTTTVNGQRLYSTSTTPTFDKTQFKLYLIDTRNTPSDAKVLSQANGDFTIVPYVPLTLNANVERVSPTSSSVYLSFAGNFFNGYYDANKANFNTITMKWRYKEVNGSWSSYTNLTLNTHFKYGSGNTYYSGNGSSQANITLANVFDYQKSYIIEISYADRLSSYTVQKPLSQGIPVHDEGVDANGDNYFNINGEFYQNNEKALQRHIITIGKNNDQNVPAGQSPIIVQMNLTRNKIGSKLTFTNNSVKIGAGVNSVLVSGLCWVEAHDGYKWVTLRKKEGSTYTTISSAITPKNTLENWDSLSLPPILIQVKENDEISMWVAITGTAAGRVAGTSYTEAAIYLTVEVVG